jgi:hypothetical protein
LWRFTIRTVALRALNTDTMAITFPNYAAGTTYKRNDIVVATDGNVYIALVGANTGNDPTTTRGFWTLYFGTTTAVPFVRAWAIGTTYIKGDVVSDGGLNWKSQVNANVGNDPTTDNGTHWRQDTNPNNSGLAFFAGEIVFTGGTSYLSLVSNNVDDPVVNPNGSWQAFTAQPTLDTYNFIYPIGTGPSSESTTRNVYVLPNGYLRRAPQDAKAAQNAFLGGPAGLRYDDWYYENNVLTSFDPGPIVFRFGCDVSDPVQFHPMFVEGYACRIALEVCEPLTQSTEKLTNIEQEYRKFMGEGRTVNGIEVGTVDPPLDEYIAVRV